MLTRPFLLAFVACWFGVNARVQGQAPSSQQPATQQPATQQPSSPQPDAGSTSVIPNVAHGPNQQQLFAVLRQVATLLGKKDFSTASRHFVLPPNFKPDMLDGMLERREISQTGIDVLERLGRYGTATEVRRRNE